MSYLDQFLGSILGGASNAVYAVALLLIAWLVAIIAKAVVMKGLRLLRAERFTDKLGIRDEVSGSSIAFIGKLVFAIVFLLFLPGALDKLGLQNVSAPIAGLTARFLNYIPNIIAAIIIVVFGAFLAKLVGGVVASLLKKTKLDSLQRKYASSEAEAAPRAVLSDVAGKLAHAAIVILALVAALQVLGIEAISRPAMAVVEQVVGVLPGLLAAIVLVAVGVFLANLISKLLESVLAGVGLDRLTDKLMPNRATPLKGSRAVAMAAKAVILVVFVAEAVAALKLSVLTGIGDAVLGYLPVALSALILLGVAVFTGAWAERLILKAKPEAVLTGRLAKAGVLVLAVFMALSQLGIAQTIVNAAFIILLAAVGVAAALAFGLGGKRFAGRMLERIGQQPMDRTAENKTTEGEAE